MSGFTKGGRDFLLLGSYNVMCAYCGRKRKANELVQDDEFARGMLCCREHRDLRQPQEFVRGIKEDMTVPKVQPPIVLFTSVAITFPISINPSAIKLLLNPVNDLTTESGFALETESGLIITTSVSVWVGTATAVLPPWLAQGSLNPFEATITSLEWTWASGGVGISIDFPEAFSTTLSTTDGAAGGVLKLTVTDSLGATAIATANVTT